MLRRLRDTNAGMIWRAVRMFLAMLIAWHTINAMRGPGSKHFTRGFVVCAPGLTSHKLVMQTQLVRCVAVFPVVWLPLLPRRLIWLTSCGQAPSPANGHKA